MDAYAQLTAGRLYSPGDVFQTKKVALRFQFGLVSVLGQRPH